MNAEKNYSLIVRKLSFYVLKNKVLFFTAFFCALISVSLTLFVPILTGKAVDNILGYKKVDFSEISGILFLLAAVICFIALFQWILSYCTNKIIYQTTMDIRNDIFSKIAKLPLRYIDSNAHGDIINKMIYDVDIISDGLLQGLTQFFVGIITILGTILFMLSINVWITVAVVFLTPLSLFAASFIAKRTHKMFKENAEIQGKLSGLISESLQNIKVIKAFNHESRSYQKFADLNGELYTIGVKSQFYSSLINPSTRFINGLVYAVVGILGAFISINGMISVGQISSFLIYSNQYTKPFNEISGVVAGLQSAIASAARVFTLLDEQEMTADGTKTIHHCDGKIEAQNVYFSYIPSRPLINDFNLSVAPGKHVAIVGPTGSGKTTIINLLMRFYDVNSGKITVDDIDINALKRADLRKQYGMVLQDTWLFNGTIRDNIAYGKPNATDEEVVQAAKDAYAHGFIKRLPLGYNTIISEDGSFSQGQKQLLSIARIMLLKPPMLLLDEATSSIDTMTEIRIQEAFGNAMRGRTSFVVAHRLSTIKNADIILVIKDGNVIEQGTHQELIENNQSFYYNLYHSMFDYR